MKIQAVFLGGPLDGQKLLVDYIEVVVHVLGGADPADGPVVSLRVAVYAGQRLTDQQKATAGSLAYFEKHLPVEYKYRGQTSTKVDLKPFLTV